MMEMETVKLVTIVERLAPEFISFLTLQELDTSIVLRDGLGVLDTDDAVEIIQISICRGQSSTVLH